MMLMMMMLWRRLQQIQAEFTTTLCYLFLFAQFIPLPPWAITACTIEVMYEMCIECVNGNLKLDISQLTEEMKNGVPQSWLGVAGDFPN
uniref:Putative secreted protein n=1 Tax=Anopheles marajoara TaxID=58244 RepID=A0A2M4CAB7_9DIPT